MARSVRSQTTTKETTMTTTEHRLISPHGTAGPWKSQEDLALELQSAMGHGWGKGASDDWQVETRTVTVTESVDRASTWLEAVLQPVK